MVWILASVWRRFWLVVSDYLEIDEQIAGSGYPGLELRRGPGDRVRDEVRPYTRPNACFSAPGSPSPPSNIPLIFQPQHDAMPLYKAGPK